MQAASLLYSQNSCWMATCIPSLDGQVHLMQKAASHDLIQIQAMKDQGSMDPRRCLV